MVKQWFPTVLCALLCAICGTLAQAGTEQNSGNKPVIYLTFDDGPSADGVTERILDVLALYDAKATFFVTGARARAKPRKIAEIISAGHGIGNHTHSHGKLTSLAEHEIAEEFSITNQYVYAAGGPQLSCFRAPFGDTDERVNGIAERMGLRSVGWTIDTRDWDPYADSDHIAWQLEDSEHNSVVLMHDGPVARWHTLDVFTRWMEDTGHLYQFKALPECVEPFTGTFATLDSPPEPPEPREKVTETIAELIEKLRNYEISLQPEIVAQNTSTPSRSF